jgi:ubiquinone/menaquinone biosynthesis C-methylase UbiE
MTDSQDYYDSISPGYEELYGEEQLKKAEVLSKLIRPKKQELLLDVGCGSFLYSGMFNCIKIGIDPSLEPLRQAGEQQEIILIQAVAEHLPFKDHSFDYVISLTAVHNFNDVSKGLQEIRRVAKGKVILTVLRQTKKLDEIEKAITRLFTVKKLILEEKDIIFVLEA